MVGFGGSDFAPFRGTFGCRNYVSCQSFILELWRNIGPDNTYPVISVLVAKGSYVWNVRAFARENTGTFTANE